MRTDGSAGDPVNLKERILSIDLLRGIAVLGILIMNIQHFSMPTQAYINPTAFGDLTGINKWVWILSNLVATDKFMSLFSLLFGAGVLIFTERAQSRGKNSALLHYRRLGWLLLFGLAHGYLFWSGDILVSYSLCGMLVFLFRNLKPKTLIWIGSGFFIIPVLFNVLSYMSVSYWPEESYQQLMNSWLPGQDILQEKISGMRGNWAERMAVRIPDTIFMQTGLFLMETFWRVMSMMLLGMALYKWEVLSARRSSGFYTRMAVLGLFTGLGLSSLGVFLNFQNEWVLEYSFFLGNKWNYVGSVGMALGYLALIMLVSNSESWSGFKTLFSGVGRMAFSNYILQTVVCILIFYGGGFGLFGSVERKFQILVVVGIWLILLVFSTLWLRRFRYGPLEWLWRSLTYKKIQPIIR